MDAFVRSYVENTSSFILASCFGNDLHHTLGIFVKINLCVRTCGRNGLNGVCQWSWNKVFPNVSIRSSVLFLLNFGNIKWCASLFNHKIVVGQFVRTVDRQPFTGRFISFIDVVRQTFFWKLREREKKKWLKLSQLGNNFIEWLMYR